MIESTTKVVNKLGIHARAAARLVSVASGFSSQIELEKGSKRANDKSIMNVMMLAATHCTEIKLYIDGPDEAEATETMLALFAGGFDEGAAPCP